MTTTATPAAGEGLPRIQVPTVERLLPPADHLAALRRELDDVRGAMVMIEDKICRGGTVELIGSAAATRITRLHLERIIDELFVIEEESHG